MHPWSGGTYVARTSSEDAISTLEPLSADGEVEWSRVIGYPESITTLPDGRGLHAGGHDFGGVTLGVGQPDAFPIDSNDHGCYVALYEADGSLAWVRTIDGGPMGGEVFVTSEANQGWFARYMASGELLVTTSSAWPRTFLSSEPGSSTVTDTVSRADGSVVLVGDFLDTLAFEPFVVAGDAGGAFVAEVR